MPRVVTLLPPASPEVERIVREIQDETDWLLSLFDNQQRERDVDDILSRIYGPARTDDARDLDD
jgi:hypothetical protein